MADATIKAWKCDICGKVYDEHSAGYKTAFSLDLSNIRGKYYADTGLDYPEICYECTMSIVDFVNGLKEKSERI